MLRVASLLLAAASVVTVTATTLRGHVADVAASPPTPVWPDTWQAPFNETAGILSKGNTTGYTWYNWPTKETRTDRASGKFDRYCGSVENSDTPCSHIVTGGKRYLWYPQLQHCCFCCDDAAGCGTLVPDWIGNSDGSYQGQVRTPTGVLADKWLVKGLQSNYWYQTPVTGAAVGLDQQPNDVQWWNPERWTTQPIPSSIFALPSSTCSQKCALFSICTVAQKYGAQSEEAAAFKSKWD